MAVIIIINNATAAHERVLELMRPISFAVSLPDRINYEYFYFQQICGLFNTLAIGKLIKSLALLSRYAALNCMFIIGKLDFQQPFSQQFLRNQCFKASSLSINFGIICLFLN
jgi:hypothetical protein